MFDILIRNGELIDGTGAPARRADIAIAGDRIADIGDLSLASATMTIEAAGRLVCPGFIDAHSHSDTYILVEPRAVSKIHQGITTEICGNCGASAAPRIGRARLPSDWADKPYPGGWRSVAEYRDLLAQVKPATNIVLFIGHNTLRAAVMGYDDRPATADELRRMQDLLAQCLEEGGRGFTTGLIYPPGMFAGTDEIVALAKVAARFNGIYASHMRSEGARLLEAIDETIGIGRDAGIRTQISHLKTSGKSNWHLLDQAFAHIRAAREAGIPVAADRYPYTASGTDLDVVFPAWAEEGGRDAILARLRDAPTRARLRADICASRPDDSWGTIILGSTWHPDLRRFRGHPLTDAARELELEPVDALLTIVEKDELRTSAFFVGMSEPNMWRILAEPWVMLGTDASLRAPEGPLSSDYPHPRAYGSFPRFLRAVLDGRSVPLEECVRKITSLPATQFGLTGRGTLAAGQAADIVVIDPVRLQDNATFLAPHMLASGIDSVIVNGQLTLDQGAFTGKRGGKML